MKKAFVFPGQGAQFVGMGKDLYENSPEAKELFEKANEILGFRITDLMFEGTDEDLKQTKVTQPAIFLHSVILAKSLKEKPDMVLVHGDTSTAFAVSLAAFYQQIPVGHVEAGLRTYNMKSPYPEEFNRQAIGLTASLHFAPTQKAANALLKEGKDPERIFITGNTGIDALHYTVRNDFYHPEIEWAKDSRLIAVTAHRRENLGEPMRDMFRAIRRIVEEFTDVKVIYPVHLNPQVRKIADEEFGGCDRIHLIEPLDVVEFHNLMKASYLIMTDSGGIQEEAPALGKPVLVMRDTTERPEGVEAGTLKLAGTKMEDIYRECRQLLTEPEIYRRMSEARNKELPHD